MKATRIKMKTGCGSSNSLLEIDQIYLEGCQEPGYYTKAAIYNFLKSHPNSIQVNIYPYPNLQPCLSLYNEKYVKSKPNYSNIDNLLCLPRN